MLDAALTTIIGLGMGTPSAIIYLFMNLLSLSIWGWYRLRQMV